MGTVTFDYGTLFHGRQLKILGECPGQNLKL
jgi:hypothetical protein